MIGFGATGVIKGSIAAAWQSSIGSVVAPSVFSTLQSAAMGGYGVQAVYGVIASIAALGAAGTAGGMIAAARIKNEDGEYTWELVGREDADKAAAAGQTVLSMTSDVTGFVGDTIRQIWEDEGNQEKIQAAQDFVENKAADASKLFDDLIDQIGEVYQSPETQEKMKQAGEFVDKIGQEAESALHAALSWFGWDN